MTRSANEYLKSILLSPVYDVAVNSDLQKLEKLSASLSNAIWLQREYQQPVKSFTLLGAYNKICQLSDEPLSKDSLASSAVNHSQVLS